jgi:hypothetical protein
MTWNYIVARLIVGALIFMVRAVRMTGEQMDDMYVCVYM